VADLVNYRVQEFTGAGAYITQWGGAGAGHGLLYSPRGIAVDHDGDVYVTRELTEQVIRVIRRWGSEPSAGPDLVLLNRPSDYHRDHRYTAQLVLDASYMLTVPLMCPDAAHLDRMPVFAYWFDGFHEGGAFRPDVVVPIDAIMGTKSAIVAQHASQVFEWLPYNRGKLYEVPPDEAGRCRYALEWMQRHNRHIADGCRAAGKLSAGCQYAEAYQISEYGRQPSAEELAALFPTA